MAITDKVRLIREAIYGKDVREAIASGIEECYNESTAGKQIDRIKTEGAAVKKEISEAKADAETYISGIINSLPSDYTSLSYDVKNVSSVLSFPKSVAGESLTIPDGKSDTSFTELRGTIDIIIDGEGDPSPNNYVDVIPTESISMERTIVCDGNMFRNDNLTIALPEPIPIGYIDFPRRKAYQTHKIIEFDGVTAGKKFTYAGGNSSFYLTLADGDLCGRTTPGWVTDSSLSGTGFRATRLSIGGEDDFTVSAYIGSAMVFQPRFMSHTDSVTTLAEANALLESWYNVGRPLKYLYKLAEPIVHDLEQVTNFIFKKGLTVLSSTCSFLYGEYVSDSNTIVAPISTVNDIALTSNQFVQKDGFKTNVYPVEKNRQYAVYFVGNMSSVVVAPMNSPNVVIDSTVDGYYYSDPIGSDDITGPIYINTLNYSNVVITWMSDGMNGVYLDRIDLYEKPRSGMSSSSNFKKIAKIRNCIEGCSPETIQVEVIPKHRTSDDYYTETYSEIVGVDSFTLYHTKGTPTAITPWQRVYDKNQGSIIVLHDGRIQYKYISGEGISIYTDGTYNSVKMTAGYALYPPGDYTFFSSGSMNLRLVDECLDLSVHDPIYNISDGVVEDSSKIYYSTVTLRLYDPMWVYFRGFAKPTEAQPDIIQTLFVTDEPYVQEYEATRFCGKYPISIGETCYGGIYMSDGTFTKTKNMIVVDGNISGVQFGEKISTDANDVYVVAASDRKTELVDAIPQMICSHGVPFSYNDLTRSAEIERIGVGILRAGGLVVAFPKSMGLSTTALANTWAANEKEAGRPFQIVYPLAANYCTTKTLSPIKPINEEGTNCYFVDHGMVSVRCVVNVENALNVNAPLIAYNDRIDVDKIALRYSSLFADAGSVESFLFFTDPHYIFVNSSWKHVLLSNMKQMAAVYNSLPIDFCLCGGDIISGVGEYYKKFTKDECLYALTYFDSIGRNLFGKNRFLNCIGNHDYGYTAGVEMSQKNLDNVLFRDEGQAYYAYRGRTSMLYVLNSERNWYIIDGKATYDFPMNEYKWEQIDWLANRLIEDDPEHAIVAMHIIRNNAGDATNFLLYRNASKLCSAYNQHVTITLNDKNYDFSDCTGTVEFFLGGHLHSDLYVDTNDGIPAVMRKQTYAGGYDTPTFDLVFCDWDNRKVVFMKVGEGSDRIVDLPTW